MTHTCTKVTVRQRAIRNNRISLYLDYYPAVRNPETMQMSRREYLGIYIYAHPKNEMEREFNNDMLNKAEAIRCIRVQSLINEEFGFLDKTKQKADFLAYFKKMCRSKDRQATQTQQPPHIPQFGIRLLLHFQRVVEDCLSGQMASRKHQ